MAYTQADLDKLDAAILTGVKRVTFADGRSTEFQSVADMRLVRADVKAELAAAASQARPRVRSVVGRMRPC